MVEVLVKKLRVSPARIGGVVALVYALLTGSLLAVWVSSGMKLDSAAAGLKVLDWPIYWALGSHRIQGWFIPLESWLDGLAFKPTMFLVQLVMRYVFGIPTYFFLGAASGYALQRARGTGLVAAPPGSANQNDAASEE